MCGRGRQNYAPAALFETARRDAGAGSTWKGQEKYKPTENLCPGKDAAVVVQAKNDGTPPQLQTKRWGLVAAFDKSLNPDFWRMFNARSETLHTSPVFRRLLRSQRSVIIYSPAPLVGIVCCLRLAGVGRSPGCRRVVIIIRD